MCFRKLDFKKNSLLWWMLIWLFIDSSLSLLISFLAVACWRRHSKAMARPPLFVTPNYSLSILPFLSVVASTCYCVRDSVVFDCSSTESACGGASSVDSGAQLCCVNGDQCGKDSICHFTKSIPNTSGYYLGGCTHPTYQDQVCQRHCSQYTQYSNHCYAGGIDGF